MEEYETLKYVFIFKLIQGNLLERFIHKSSSTIYENITKKLDLIHVDLCALHYDCLDFHLIDVIKKCHSCF